MAWTERGSIRGPEGPQGPTGATGATGADGGTTPHAARHAVGGSDPVSPASIGASATTHTHSYIPTSSAGAASGVATLDSNTRVPTAQMPRVPTTVRTVTYAATITLDPTVDGNIVNITATGDITSLGASTTGVTDGQVLRVRVLASAATRAVTIASAIRTSTSLTRGAYSIPSGQVLICAFEYVSLVSAYVLTAATISAT